MASFRKNFLWPFFFRDFIYFWCGKCLWFLRNPPNHAWTHMAFNNCKRCKQQLHGVSSNVSYPDLILSSRSLKLIIDHKSQNISTELYFTKPVLGCIYFSFIDIFSLSGRSFSNEPCVFFLNFLWMFDWWDLRPEKPSKSKFQS